MAPATTLRPKHIPQRTCVGCGSTLAKHSLVRVVRTPGGRIEIDPFGKKAGRGAYLCPNPSCWEQALRKGRLERSLKTHLSSEDAAGLLAQAPHRVSHSNQEGPK